MHANLNTSSHCQQLISKSSYIYLIKQISSYPVPSSFLKTQPYHLSLFRRKTKIIFSYIKHGNCLMADRSRPRDFFRGGGVGVK